MPLANEPAIFAIQLSSKMGANADRRLWYTIYFVHMNLAPKKGNAFGPLVRNFFDLTEWVFHIDLAILFRFGIYFHEYPGMTRTFNLGFAVLELIPGYQPIAAVERLASSLL